MKINIAVLVSGGGTNLAALMEAEKKGAIKSGGIRLVVSDREGVYALERAKAARIAALTIDKKKTGKEGFEKALLSVLEEYDIHLIVLAGFLSILSEGFVRRYEGRIINVHPSLIPAFCGDGFYGLKVHEAALKRGVRLSGATVHLVNGETDGGPILFQKAVKVRKSDTPETLQKRIMEQAEWVLLPRAAEAMSKKIGKELQR